MKDPKSVGGDFDEYARRWREQNYRMEVAGGAAGLETGDAANVKLPGDEWGDIKPLLDLYSKMFAHYLPGDEKVNFVEIGAGGGRSTQCVLELLGERIDTYTVIDVSYEFTRTLKDRVGDAVEIEILSDVDLSALDADKYDFCLAQSSWSHISMYDQYRYLRELRRVMKDKAPVAVIGQFLLGVGKDWTFNRFNRRVYQIDKEIHGVYHEFLGVSSLAEFLERLRYRTDIVFNSGFIARDRAGSYGGLQHHMKDEIRFPYLMSLGAFFDGATPRMYTLPSVQNPELTKP